jgi:hypothetical protein
MNQRKIFKLDPELVKTVEWTGDDRQYDLDLFELVQLQGHEHVLVVNPYLSDPKLELYIEQYADIEQCQVWTYKDEWVAKLFRSDWHYDLGFYVKEIKKPYFIWTKNPDLDRLMTFVDDPYSKFEPDPWDMDYKLIWYMDPRFNPLEDKVWVMSAQRAGKEVLGTKDMGYLTPDVTVTFNEHLPDFNIDIDACCPAFYDLAWECAWELDQQHITDERQYIFKFTPNYRKVKEWKWYGTISPEIKIEYNSTLPQLDYGLDYSIPWHDLAYEHVWMLDTKHSKNLDDEIWAVKMSATATPTGTKIVDYVSPQYTVTENTDLAGYEFAINYDIQYYDFKYEHVWNLDSRLSGGQDIWAIRVKLINKPQGWKNIGELYPLETVEYNTDLKNLKLDIDYDIPYYDRYYTHVWYLDELYTGDEKIWAAKKTASSIIWGEKDAGRVVPLLANRLDVVFISYNEPNAEKNWPRVLEKAPWAKRVDGIRGIFQAHKAAAGLADTDMFYVVDGDAWLVDSFEFNYQPGIFDRDCSYVWSSKNPINDLVYGYGGVKLFSKSALLNLRSWNDLDMFAAVVRDIKVMEEISNVTEFNTDPFSTWRSAFRECVKLYHNSIQQPENLEQKNRLEAWLVSRDQYAVLGAKEAIEYAEKYINDHNSLLKINDRVWLEKQFNKKVHDE